MYLALDGAERLLTFESQDRDPAMYPGRLTPASSSAAVQRVSLQLDRPVGVVGVVTEDVQHVLVSTWISRFHARARRDEVNTDGGVLTGQESSRSRPRTAELTACADAVVGEDDVGDNERHVA